MKVILLEDVKSLGKKDEIVEVKHTALSKEVFANGAVAALKALMNKDKGLFDLKTLY